MTSDTPPSMTIEQALHQAITHHQSGQLQDAERLYRAILQIQPKHPDANHNLGLLAVQMKQPAAGLPHLMTALETDPTQSQYWLSYIDALIQAGMLDAARQVLLLGQQQGLQGDEVEALAAYLQADTQTASYQGDNPSPGQINTLAALFNEGKNAEAASLAQQMTMDFPQHGFGWMVLGALFQQMGRSADALAPMQKAAALSPHDDEAHYNLGNLLKLLGRLDEAEASYRRALEIKPNDAETHYNLGNTLKDQGRPDEAEASYRRAIQVNPNFAEAHNNLGITLHEQRRLDEAEAGCRQALQIKPDYAEAHNNLGSILQDLGRLNEAEASFRQALAIKTDYAQAHSNLGNALQYLDRPNEAETSYRRALAIKPDYAQAHSNLGNTLQYLGRLDEAEASYRQALELKPDLAEAHNNLGNTLKNLGRPNEAEQSYRQALQAKPDFADAHYNLGAILKYMGRPDEAETCYRSALKINPYFAEAYNSLGSILQGQGRISEAKACYREASELGFNGARIREALILPTIIGTRQEMLESRAAFERNLDQLIADKLTVDDPLKSVGETNFYLAFQCLNDRDLQVKVAKFYEQACPSLLYTAPHCTQPKSGSQEKIRIGFLSKYLNSHSVSLCFSKIIESLSLKEPFEAVLISNHRIDEKIYGGFAGQRLHLPNNLPAARNALAALELDILVYLDIGMEPLSYFLAFSRLAHAQCVMGGHPVTTGITNIDYFLSSELMEPSDADEHYSEKLVRLARPVFYFTRPILPVMLKTRHELNLPSERHIYMCPMKLQKIHPDFDEAISRILQIDAKGVIVLFEDSMWTYWKKALLKRFETTIPAKVRERILFLPWLKGPDFISAIAAADVILDPFHFGIGSTAIMVFATNTPLITKVGEFMRGRVGTGFCKMLDLTECIAEDRESYIQKAVAIANNRHLREQISAKIRQNNSVLYENLQPIEDFVDFFDSLTAKAGIAQQKQMSKSKPNKASKKTTQDSPNPQQIAAMTRLFNEGRIAELETLFRTWIVRFPNYVPGWQALAALLKQQGQSAAVLSPLYKTLAELLPADADAQFRFGNIQLELGQLDDAIASYRRAVAINPDFAEAHSNLGVVLLRQGRMAEAEACQRRSLAISPDFLEAKINFAACVKYLGFSKDDSGEVRATMIQALSEAWGRPSDLARVGVSLVKLNQNIGETIAKAAEAWPQRLPASDLFNPASLDEVSSDPLLHALLISTPNCDSELEYFLTMARKSMLDAAIQSPAADCENPVILNFYSALARQCFINEYVFAWTDDEAIQAQSLRDSLIAALETGAPIPALLPLTVAAYFPLHSLPLAIRLLNKPWPEAVSAVLEQQVIEPEEERQYRANMPRLTPVDDDVSLLVQNQYEENPYPRWIKTALAEKPSTISGYFRSRFPLSPLQPLDKDCDPDILIAGCGTGLHSIQTAQSFQGARVLAVDLSLTSLCYAKRKTRELGIAAIEFAQADILKLGQLDRRFDIVESVGVLHHLDNPWTGWQVLLSLLRPGGLMRLGFYSEAARRDIVRARDFIAEQGYGSTKEDIRRCRQDLMNLDESMGFSPVIKSADFFSISDCRDLLFHVQEHRMTLTAIEAFLRDNHLQFLGFDIPAHTLQAYRQRFPDDPAATSLAYWQMFENDNPYTFVEMYQFWVQRMN